MSPLSSHVSPGGAGRGAVGSGTASSGNSSVSSGSSGGTAGRSDDNNGPIRVVVIGDKGTGKTSLIVACLTEAFPDRPPPVLPPTRLPLELFPEKVPLLVVDTSSKPEDAAAVEEEVARADAVVVTYACHRPDTLASLTGRWLPMLRRLRARAPVVVTGCMLDMRTSGDPGLEDLMSPVMNEFREIETCLECSALHHLQVTEVFYYAQRAVLLPTGPLFDQKAQTLRPRCVRALKRIFLLCDRDTDDALSDEELNAFQVECFAAPLAPEELRGVKRVVAEKLPEGVAAIAGGGTGLTLAGFLFLHALFIERGRLETAWTVLRRFGYSDRLELRQDLAQHAAAQRRKPDQSVELAPCALKFLHAKFHAFDRDRDGALSAAELSHLFGTAPSEPWLDPPYHGCSASCREDDGEAGGEWFGNGGDVGGDSLSSGSGGSTSNASGQGSVRGSRKPMSFREFTAVWSLMALLDPPLCVANLLYLGYPLDKVQDTLVVTRQRRSDRKAGSSGRRVVQCFVFGPRGAGKSKLLDALLGQPFSGHYVSTEGSRYAVAAVPSSDVAGRGDAATGVGSAGENSSSSSSSSSSNSTGGRWSSSSNAGGSRMGGSAGTGASGEELSVANAVVGVQSDKILVLREIAGDAAVNSLLTTPDSLADADVALFVYDSRDRDSWEGAVRLLERVAAAAELQGNEMPCLLAAAKGDEGSPHPDVFAHSARLCAEMGVRAPLPVSARLGDVRELWAQLLQAAAHPRLGVPETSAARLSRVQRRRLMMRALSVAAVGTVVAVAVVVGYRVMSASQKRSGGQ